MKKIISALLFTVPAVALQAQDMTGDWYGVLEVQARKLPIIFHIARKDNALSGTMDSPNQGAKDLKMDSVAIDGSRLFVSAKYLKMTYNGVYDADKKIVNGVFAQGTAEIMLMLSRNVDEIKPERRPQDPVDFPYNREEVTFKNAKDNVTLAGTLTTPKDRKADKLVILITGSGPQNRDEELAAMNHRPFLVWSDWLTRHGIAVLRYDDRGTGSSTGQFMTATSADFADDVTSAIDYLRSRKDIGGMEIGLMGHSEGGMIAPMVAARDKRVGFIVLLAGPGVPIGELLAKQAEMLGTGAGTPKELLQLRIKSSEEVYDFLKKNAGRPTADVEPELKKLLEAQLTKYPSDAPERTSKDMVATELTSSLSPWFRYFVTFDPGAYLSKVKCPVLALNGSLDRQVNATQNLEGIRAGLKKAKNKQVEIMEIPTLNHLFQRAETGSPAEYGIITETVNPSVLEKVSDWITELKN